MPLSSLPHAVTSPDAGMPEDLVYHLSTTCISATHIKEWTNKDKIETHPEWRALPEDTSGGHTCDTEIEQLVRNYDGLPQKVVTDNGPSFISHEFQDFLSQNSIVGITSAPYHPSTNGLAERAVQSLKAGLKKTSGATILPIQNYTTHNHWCTTSWVVDGTLPTFQARHGLIGESANTAIQAEAQIRYFQTLRISQQPHPSGSQAKLLATLVQSQTGGRHNWMQTHEPEVHL